MMNNTSLRALMAELDARSIQYEIGEVGTSTILSCTYTLNNTSAKINVFFDDGDDSHVTLRAFSIIKASEDKKSDAIHTCNACNLRYKWAKFVLLEDDNEVAAQCDAIVYPESAGPILYELLLRMFSIIDDCYPVFMKAIGE